MQKSNVVKLMKMLKFGGSLVGLVLIVVWSAGLLQEKQAPGKMDALDGRLLPEGAVVHEVVALEMPTRVSLSGTVHSERRIHLSSRIPAYVKDIHVMAGSVVKDGDLLIELDQRELLKELAAAEAQLSLAETGYQRSDRLLKTNATTVQAFEMAESGYKAALAGVERIKVMLTYTQITSPINGVVTDRHVETGDLAGAGQGLLSVYDPERLRLDVPVPARLVSKFPVGQKVTVTLDQVATPVEGKVVEIVSEFDPVTRTRRVKIHLVNVKGDVLPGMYGQVAVDLDPQPVVLVPQDAVTAIGQLTYVQKVAGARCVTRWVTTGRRMDDRIEILSGVSHGDRLLLNK